ncbi:hypothetical protein [Parendozoicomonas haliclonae]|uniref:Lipocalin-like domain-containing protein n=1 Tax=Parendozoicomonas haliclonae TaxID=1960125 RepID=A0A1X7AIH2_9GAMM|nr:hypothetical protein [Parendozoicomonas haliclonae]SMA43766.1 hypothetical protein EHSB41UT_01661 [Parendozoicomonas haliclonae]
MRPSGFTIGRIILAASALMAFPLCADNSPFDGKWSGTFDTTIKSKDSSTALHSQNFMALGSGNTPTCSCQMTAEISIDTTNPSAQLHFAPPTATDAANDSLCKQYLKNQCNGQTFSNNVTLSDDNVITLSIDPYASQDFNYVYNLTLANGQLTGAKTASLPSDATKLSIHYTITLQHN